MKSVKIGSSIKVNRNAKEDFLTVELSGGDIILHKRGRIIAKREFKDSSFTYNNIEYKVK